MKEYADWWLGEFHQLMNEKREAIEKRICEMSTHTYAKTPAYAVALLKARADISELDKIRYHQALALYDVLSILKD